MGKLYKFIVFAGLLIQFGFAYGANHHSTISSRKDNNTAFSKENLNPSHFVQPSIERGNPDLKQNNRIPVDTNFFSTASYLFLDFEENPLKILLSYQDVNRCDKVSILLFPFHYFW